MRYGPIICLLLACSGCGAGLQESLDKSCDVLAEVDRYAAKAYTHAAADEDTPPEVMSNLDKLADVIERAWGVCFEEE